MPSMMRDYLRFQGADPSQLSMPSPTPRFGQSDDDDELGALLKQMQGYQSPQMPMMPAPRRAPLPVRPQQSLWDILPQLLAGAGDTLNAGAGVRSDSLGRVMGMQRGMRDQAYGDQVNQQNLEYDNKRADVADAMHRYQMESAAQNQMFSRNSKLAELLMMHQALSDAAKKKNAMRQIFEQGLPGQFGEAGSPQDLDKASIAALEKTGGDEAMMNMVTAAKQKRLQGMVQQQRPGSIQKSVQGVTGTDNYFYPQLRGWLSDWWNDFNGPQPPNPPMQNRSVMQQFGEGMRYWHP